MSQVSKRKVVTKSQTNISETNLMKKFVGCALEVYGINPGGYVGFQMVLPPSGSVVQFQVFGPKASWRQYNLGFDSSLVYFPSLPIFLPPVIPSPSRNIASPFTLSIHQLIAEHSIFSLKSLPPISSLLFCLPLPIISFTIGFSYLRSNIRFDELRFVC